MPAARSTVRAALSSASSPYVRLRGFRFERVAGLLTVALVVLLAAHQGVPQSVAAAGTVQVSAGAFHTCAVTAAGALHCWGRNDLNQATVPAGLDQPDAVLQVSTGIWHSCAVTATGAVQCWGLGADDQTAVPGGLGAVAQVSAGGFHTCAVTVAGAVHCWGANTDGQRDVPGGLGTVVQVSAGERHTCVVTDAAELHCWGSDTFDQVALPGGLGTVAQVSAGRRHTCALTTAGVVRCWGLNGDDQTVVPGGLGPVSQVSGGYHHTCALTTAGTVRCWGDDDNGQSSVPGDLGPVAQIDAGDEHTCAVTVAGVVRCWGDTSDGQTRVPAIFLNDVTPPDARISIDPATRTVLVEGVEASPPGSGPAQSGPIGPTTCAAQRTGQICVYRVSDLAGNSVTLTLLITQQAGRVQVQVQRLQLSGSAAGTPLSNSLVLEYAPGSGAPSSTTQTLSVIEPGSPAISRQLRATWSSVSNATTVSFTNPAAPALTCQGQQVPLALQVVSGALRAVAPACPAP